jgi:hypothetical protein
MEKDKEKLHFIVGVKEQESQIHLPDTKDGNLFEVLRSYRAVPRSPHFP